MSDWNTPLTLTAVTAGSTVQLTKVGSPTVSGLQYRTDSSAAWSSYTIDDVITLANVGDYVQFQNSESNLSSNTSNYVNFVMTGSIEASGNTQSLLNYSESCSSYCFFSLFNGCAVLTAAPELPSSSLANSCYRAMFGGCSSLAVAPKLVATTLFDSCYRAMFLNCSSLVTPPELPATTLASFCYNSMFNGCTSLVDAPILPAPVLLENCYSFMFRYCSSLSSIRVFFKDWNSSANATSYWCEDVGALGNFYKPSSLADTRGISNIPASWTLKSEYKPLTFTANTAGSTVQLTKTGEPTVSGLQYRTSSSDVWSSYTIDTVITLTNVGDYVQFQNTENALSLGASNYVRFVMTGSIACSGNIQAMMDYAESCTSYCYLSLFYHCTALANTPDIPATTLATGCYQNMFEGCSGITSTCATLPAMTLAVQCYLGMYRGCSALTTAPSLPAITLTASCYYAMFYNCSALTAAPTLSATTLADSCYYYMFSGCRALTTTPQLPATTMASNCYRGMFNNCSGLNSAADLPATTLAVNCYYQMFDSCTNLTAAPVISATTLASYSCYNMFKSCSKLEKIYVSFTSWLDGATPDWLSGVSSSGVFYKPLALPDEYGASRIPSGWQVINTDEIECSPGLPTDIDPIGITVEEQLPLTLTAVEDSTVTLNAVGSPTTSGLKFKTQSNANWSTYTPGTTIQLPAGKSVQFWNSAETLSLSANVYAQFSMTGVVRADGNIQSMLNYSQTCPDYSLRHLFLNCSSLISPPECPAKTVKSWGCSSTFRGTSITKSPALPATAVEDSGYRGMFRDCKNMASLSDLMVMAPASNCFYDMCVGCIRLTAVKIATTTLSESCLDSAFFGCSSLQAVEVEFSAWHSNATRIWLSGVSASGTFVKPAALPEEYGASRIPSGWTVINKD